MARYRFVDHWYVRAPIAEVFQHIGDPRTYPRWWPAYSEIEVLPGVEPPDVGSRTRLAVVSPLGYRLRLDVEVTESEPPRRLNSVSRGDLAGTGLWEFEPQGDTTHVKWTWVVESRHPLLNLLEPIAKPLFAWSHNYVSGRGHRGLKRLLERR